MEEVSNKWLIAGLGAAVLAFAFLYIRAKKAATSQTAGELIQVAPGTAGNLSQSASIPETGVNIGNYPAFASGLTNTPTPVGTVPISTTGTTPAPTPTVPNKPNRGHGGSQAIPNAPTLTSKGYY